MTLMKTYNLAGVADTLQFGKGGPTILAGEDDLHMQKIVVENELRFDYEHSLLYLPSGLTATRPNPDRGGVLRNNIDGFVGYLEYFNGRGWQRISQSTGITAPVRTATTSSQYIIFEQLFIEDGVEVWKPVPHFDYRQGVYVR